jgi:putative Mg2+ transporter-C (MgtC) family protein
MPELMEDILRIVLAVVVGGLIGIEREFRDKAAGFRTIIFICIGATLFTLLSVKLAGSGEPTRIAANIVSGVGFLGAGVILREGGRVTGLTTAATIWLTAALGMGLGSGEYVLIAVAVLLALVALWVFPLVEKWINKIHEERTYEIVCRCTPAKLKELENMFQQSGLHTWVHRQMKSADNVVCIWSASGSMRAHQHLSEALFADPEIIEFRS